MEQMLFLNNGTIYRNNHEESSSINYKYRYTAKSLISTKELEE